MRWRYKGVLLGSSALAAVSLAGQVVAQDPGASPPAPFHQSPAPAPAPSPTPSPSETPPSGETPPPAAEPGFGTTLPTISVEASRPKPKPTTATPATTEQTTAQSGPPAPPVPVAPPPYETGAPNVAGGPPVAPQLASQMTVSGKDINARPMTRPGEVVEAAPDLTAIDHSDGGKANQYYLRGWNLDHGTDFATFVDDMPINLPSNVHGQGYTDLNWLIPEAINGVDVRKGPFFADVGDFENAGNLHLSLRDSVDENIAGITVGNLGYTRTFGIGSTKMEGGGNLLYAGEFETYNGPWSSPDDIRKFSGLMRYSQGTATDGLSITAAAYTQTWGAADQVPQRARGTGQIGLYGEIDPTDGGDASRFSLSGRITHTDDEGSIWKANVYFVRYTQDLFNNFTYVTVDPVNGDQFHQHEDRFYTGAGVSRQVNGTLAGLPTEWLYGLQVRYDDVNNAISNTVQRQFLSNTLLDHVDEVNAGIYIQNTTHWTDWFKTTAGWRGDTFAATINSVLQPANSGKDQMTIGSPKFTATLGPFYKTEFFAGVGMGYHSNDARSTVITQVPAPGVEPATPQGAAPLLVRSRGGEVGIRTTAIPNLDSSLSAFYIHQNSELFFDGDTGTTAAGPPSQRTGIEFNNNYRIADWFHIDANLALSRARFLGLDENQNAIYQSILQGMSQSQLASQVGQQVLIGNAPGNFVFNAPWMVASAGLTVGDKTGWFSSLRWRYISSRPLTEDGTFQSVPFNVINGTVGYKFENGWRIQLDALNMLNSTTDQATYAYGSLLTTDRLFSLCFPAAGTPVPKGFTALCQNGITDYVGHPMEPLAIRLTLAGPIDKLDVPAMASELRHAIPEYRAPAANYDWSGFYVGAHVGNSSTKTTASTINTASGAPAAPDGLTPSDWNGGLQVGYDYMMPSRVVVGITGDISSGGRQAALMTDASGNTSASQLNVFDSESLRARLGFAVDNLLFYGTAGWAWSSNQYVRTQLTGDLNLASAGTAESSNRYLSGWTAGGGLMAYAFEQHWNVFAEYRHTSYGAADFSLPFSQLFTTTKTEVNTINVGLNYKFDAGSAPAPRVPSVQPASLAYKTPPAGHAFNWTGLNFGIDGGYGGGSSTGTLTDAGGTPLTAYSYNVAGPFAGLSFGGDYQLGRFVIGAEGDWQWGNLTGNNQPGLPQAGPEVNTMIKDYGSIRGRFGVLALDRFMLFGTVGWAWGNPSNTYSGASGPVASPSFTSTGFTSGWTAGAGIEYAVTDSIFARLEYRHTSLEAPKFADLATNLADITNKVPMNDFRAGLVYKFKDIPFLRGL